MPKMTDAELVAAIEAEEALCLDTLSGELQKERADALDRYRGLPLGNEVEGRSQVVDKSVLDTIEWIMPSLVRIYLGGDTIGQFEARGPEDEEAAKAETDVCNWYLEAKNDFFSQINSTLRDALLLKNGYMVGFWQSKYDTMEEQYKGLADEEATMLAQDGEIKVIEHSEYPDPNWVPPMNTMPGGPQSATMGGVGMGAPPFGPAGVGGQAGEMPAPPMLHDIRIERKACEEFVAVESIPPDELLVSRNHRWTSLLDAAFVQWRRRTTIGQLRAEGFDIEDDEPGDNDFTQEWVERQRFNENQFLSDETTDPARRMVTLRDTYMRIDLRGTGKQQLWRICILQGSSRVILREQVDIVPFAAFSPIIYPHSHIGSSVYDLIQDVSNIKTALSRQFLDGVYQANSGRVAVNMNTVTLDDLLVNRPGQIVRVDGDPNGNIVPIQSVDVTGSVLQGLEYMDTVKEQRAGVSRNPAGLDPNVLQSTATGVAAASAGSEMRIELIARTLAGGFKDLFLIIHSLALKHSTKALQIKLKGKWSVVNPREWTRRTDFSINVGLGTGTPQAQMQKLMAMQPVMQQAHGLGLAGVTELYNFGSEMWKAAGWKNPDKFIKPPQTDPHTGKPMEPPPSPPPEVMVAQIKAQAEQALGQQKTQADMQIAGMKAQHDKELAMAQLQVDAQKAQLSAQTTQASEAARTQADVAVQQHKITTDSQREFEKAQIQMQVDGVRIDKELAAQIQMNAEKVMGQIEVARINASIADGQNAQKALADQAGIPEAADPVKIAQEVSKAVTQAMAAPRVRRIARGPDGRATHLIDEPAATA